MKSAVITLFLVCWLSCEAKSRNAAATAVCDSGWLQTGKDDHRITCIRMQDSVADWYHAKAICTSIQASLLEINSPNESDLLHKHFDQVLPGGKFEDTPIWMGGNDLARLDRWVWASSGSMIFPFVNWMPGRPNRSGNCVALHPKSFQWFDEECTNQAYFFCEQKVKLVHPEDQGEWHSQISFLSSGYIELNKKMLAHGPDVTNDIKLELSTINPDGLILWVGRPQTSWLTSGASYLALAVTDGRVEFAAGGAKVRAKRSIDDGQPHRIHARLFNATIWLKVDDEQPEQTPTGLIDHKLLEQSDVFLGGLPEDEPYYGVSMATDQLYSHGFDGCIHGLTIHNSHLGQLPYGQTVDFGDRHLNKASSGVTSSNSCTLQAKPTYGTTPKTPLSTAASTSTASSSTKPSYSSTSAAATTKPPYRPTTAATTKPPYRPTTTTTTTLRTTTTTTTTRSSSSSSKPSYFDEEKGFDGSNFFMLMDYVIDLNMLNSPAVDSVSIELEISTGWPMGLLVWQGLLEASWVGYEGSFWSLSLSEGFVLLQLDWSSTGTKQLRSQVAVNDNRPHVIRVTFYQDMAQMFIDNKLQEPNALDYELVVVYPERPTYIGGVPLNPKDNPTADLFIGENFSGCLNRLEVQYGSQMKKKVSLSQQAVASSPQAQSFSCGSLPKPPTTTKRTTTTRRTTTTARTTTTTTRTTSTSTTSIRRTTSPSRPTSAATTTMSTPYPDNCPHKEVSFESSFVVLRGKYIGNVEADSMLKVVIDFTTSDNYGLILWQGTTMSGKNWLSIGIMNGKLAVNMTVNQGKDVIMLSSMDKVNARQYTVAQIQKTNTELLLAVNGREVARQPIPRHGPTQYTGDIFFGGMEGRIYSRTDGLYDSGFKGCVHKLVFSNGYSGHLQIDFSNSKQVIRRSPGVQCRKCGL